MSEPFNLVTCKAFYKCTFILQDTLDTSQISVKYRKKVFMMCEELDSINVSMYESFLQVNDFVNCLEKCLYE